MSDMPDDEPVTVSCPVTACGWQVTCARFAIDSAMNRYRTHYRAAHDDVPDPNVTFPDL